MEIDLGCHNLTNTQDLPRCSIIFNYLILIASVYSTILIPSGDECQKQKETKKFLILNNSQTYPRAFYYWFLNCIYY
jgi:hypothetical protein